jgi:hypothetical protein
MPSTGLATAPTVAPIPTRDNPIAVSAAVLPRDGRPVRVSLVELANRQADIRVGGRVEEAALVDPGGGAAARGTVGVNWSRWRPARTTSPLVGSGMIRAPVTVVVNALVVVVSCPQAPVGHAPHP